MTSDPASSADDSRKVERLVQGVQTSDGAGVRLTRVLTQQLQRRLDPFLMLDAFRNENPEDYIGGFPDHPHRGFETVTYLLEGRMEHGDSRGNRGRLGPGDVQWMTAGSGVVHSEMPEAEFAARGGRMHGFQLWVNLPRKDKLMAPRYQEVPAAQIPVGRSADGRVTARVLAGEALGARAVIDTRTPIAYLDVTLAPGAVLEQPLPEDFNAFAYVVEGSGLFGAERTAAGPHQLALFKNDGGAARLEAAADAPLRALLIGGRPLDEPVARAGPFVMNTRAEVVQAFEDFQSGRLG